MHGGYFFHRFGIILGIAPHDRDDSAFRGQHFGNTRADAFGAAGDHDDFVVQV